MASVWLESHGKAIVAKGDTMQIKDFLKSKGGKWNAGLKCWIWPGSKKATLLQDLQSCSAVQKVQDKTDSATAQPSSTASEKPAAKAAAKAPEKRNAEEEEQVIELAGDVRATVNSFQGKTGVDLRKFFTDKASGEPRPTAKGVRLSPTEWEAVRKATHRIDSALSEGKESFWNLEGDLNASIGPGSVDLRRFYEDKKDGEKKPGKKGIRLSSAQWSSLKAEMDSLDKFLSGGAGSGGPPNKKPKVQKAKAEKPSADIPHEDEDHGRWKAELAKIMEGRDLQQLSLRKVRGELEAALNLPEDALLSRKEEVKNLVTSIIQGQST